MKRYIALFLAVVMLFTAVGCKKGDSSDKKSPEESTNEIVVDESLKVGFILPSDLDSPDTKVREEAIRKTQHNIGLSDNQVIMTENVTKDDCEEKIEEQIKKDCKVIFACGARFEETVLQLAAKHSDVEFCIEGGKEAQTSELPNVRSYNSRIFEAYYVAGIAAGKEINYRLNKGDIVPSGCTIGFVAYKDCAETTSCINAFYIGLKQITSQCNVAVRYVGKRGNYDADGEAARQLVAQGICMMVTYTYTTAAAAVCAENGIPVIGNQDNIINIAPKKAITSTFTDWSVYYTELINQYILGNDLSKDWCGGYAQGCVRLTQINDAHIADGIAAALIEVEDELRKGKTKIFDLENFTIDGSNLESLAKEDKDYKKYLNYIEDGQLLEQVFTSVPIFEDYIDGISESTENYIPEDEPEESTEEQ